MPLYDPTAMMRAGRKLAQKKFNPAELTVRPPLQQAQSPAPAPGPSPQTPPAGVTPGSALGAVGADRTALGAGPAASQPPPAAPPPSRGDPNNLLVQERDGLTSSGFSAPTKAVADPTPVSGVGTIPDKSTATGKPATADNSPEKTPYDEGNEKIDAITQELLDGQQSEAQRAAREETANAGYNRELRQAAALAAEQGTPDTTLQAVAEAQAQAQRQNTMGGIEKDVNQMRMDELARAAALTQMQIGNEMQRAPDTDQQAVDIIEGAFNKGYTMDAEGNVYTPSGELVDESAMSAKQRAAVAQASKGKTGQEKTTAPKDEFERKQAVRDMMGEWDQGYSGGDDEDLGVISAWVDSFASGHGRWPTNGELYNYLDSIGEEDLPDISGRGGEPAFSAESYQSLYGKSPDGKTSGNTDQTTLNVEY